MKVITRYQSDDGKYEFLTAEKCMAHESLCAQINSIMWVLPELPKGNLEFSHGEGYIQHNRLAFEKAKTDLILLANEKFPNSKKAASIEAMMRFYVEGTPFYAAFDRFSNTDSEYREWGQKYYQLNPDSRILKQLNP